MTIVGGPNPDEAAAILAAIAAYLRDESETEPSPAVSPWTLAGRREAQGLAVDRRALRAGWGR
ncbi:MAG TPA: hypothetical protein VFA78_03215 [Chloroflexota bacterium]|nr:hypothetical protein [Chloroflexota bacterium]